MKEQNIKLYQIKIDLENGNLAPERGVIKDFFDKEIASNEQVYQVHLIPENSKDIEKLFVRLKTILNITDKKFFYLKKINKKTKTLGTNNCF